MREMEVNEGLDGTSGLVRFTLVAKVMFPADNRVTLAAWHSPGSLPRADNGQQ